MSITIRPMAADDWPTVERIYREGIATGNATFEEDPPSWEDFDRGKVISPRLVAVDHGNVVGWAAASRTSSRCVYEGVLEHSVYVAEEARGRGVGKQLLRTFLEASETAGIWTVQSGVFPENASSMALHHELGFRDVGTRERVGKMTYGPYAGQWRDVVLIERRSTTIN
ncbi:MAG: N-acetyltransferase [Microbacteriaceae bacterium]|jgi:L-amino acid N-acyltransferase YncA|nr:N-acetyltransferase [Microbacteriaceae bacterium]